MVNQGQTKFLAPTRIPLVCQKYAGGGEKLVGLTISKLIRKKKVPLFIMSCVMCHLVQLMLLLLVNLAESSAHSEDGC